MEGMEGSVKDLEAELDVIGRGFDNLEATVENLNNFQRKNILRIRGLKENIEGKNLSGYGVDLFSSWLSSEFEIERSISSASRVGIYRPTNKHPRDIIVRFPYWSTRAKVLESHWEQPAPIIKGSQVNLYPDI